MDQATALTILKSGHNVLLTGSAGTGKTYVLNQFIAHLKEHGVKHAVTASTGLAATHLGGTTIHSWAKIAIYSHLPANFIAKMPEKDKERIMSTDVLIIDEISMLHDYRLDLVDEVCRKVRKNSEPFGGMQVVLCGDFFQLPPVNGRDDRREGRFAIHANIWEPANFQVCYLTKSYRQAEDDSFNDILNAIRFNDVRRRHAESLLSRVDVVLPSHIQPTQLFVTNIDTERINKDELARIDEPEHVFEAVTAGRKQYVESLLKSCLAEEELRLKVGAQVMFVRNNPAKGYINGTLGTVIDFTSDDETPLIRTTDGRTIVVERETWELKEDEDSLPKARLSQYPLKLAWAITVHKSQGMTLDAAIIDLRRAFVEGMGYVALSRVRSLDNLVLLGINKMALRVAEEALQIDENLRKLSDESANNIESLQSSTPHYVLHKPSEIKNAPKPVDYPNQSKKGPNGGTPLTELRKTYPNAYAAWNKKEDEQLLDELEKGVSVKELSKIHGRQPGSIRSRIKKLTD